MKQPKFKFGDKVQTPGGKPFEVLFVSYDKSLETYLYNNTSFFRGVLEFDLDLYVEPKNLKLFAFQSTRRHQDIMWKDTPLGENGYYKRAPEHDKYIQ